jgi:dipeptidyl aminopeptidase/acylaminoacyl peptidase
VNEIGAGGQFRISPDGREVVYALTETGKDARKGTLWIVGVDGLNRRQVPITFAPGEIVIPHWSPDGSRLALEVTQSNGQLRKLKENQILIIDRDGKNARTLPLPPWNPMLLDWK